MTVKITQVHLDIARDYCAVNCPDNMSDEDYEQAVIEAAIDIAQKDHDETMHQNELNKNAPH